MVHRTDTKPTRHRNPRSLNEGGPCARVTPGSLGVSRISSYCYDNSSEQISQKFPVVLFRGTSRLFPGRECLLLLVRWTDLSRSPLPLHPPVTPVYRLIERRTPSRKEDLLTRFQPGLDGTRGYLSNWSVRSATNC